MDGIGRQRTETMMRMRLILNIRARPGNVRGWVEAFRPRPKREPARVVTGGRQRGGVWEPAWMIATTVVKPRSLNEGSAWEIHGPGSRFLTKRPARTAYKAPACSCC